MKTWQLKLQSNLMIYTYKLTYISIDNFPRVQNVAPNQCGDTVLSLWSNVWIILFSYK